MATLNELATRLREANPKNEPMVLHWMAEQFWPGERWLEFRATRHNGGARRGALVAAGIAGRMAKRGMLKRHIEVDEHACKLSMWVWVTPK